MVIATEVIAIADKKDTQVTVFIFLLGLLIIACLKSN
jgi:hypothetical protein